MPQLRVGAATLFFILHKKKCKQAKTRINNFFKKTIKLLEKNIRRNLWSLELGEELFDLTPEAPPIKGKIDEYFKNLLLKDSAKRMIIKAKG